MADGDRHHQKPKLGPCHSLGRGLETCPYQGPKNQIRKDNLVVRPRSAGEVLLREARRAAPMRKGRGRGRGRSTSSTETAAMGPSQQAREVPRRRPRQTGDATRDTAASSRKAVVSREILGSVLRAVANNLSCALLAQHAPSSPGRGRGRGRDGATVVKEEGEPQQQQEEDEVDLSATQKEVLELIQRVR